MQSEQSNKTKKDQFLVYLDFVKSKIKTDHLDSDTYEGEGVHSFLENLLVNFVCKAITRVLNNNSSEELSTCNCNGTCQYVTRETILQVVGDGFYLIFSSADNAYAFTKAFYKIVDERNRQHTQNIWEFKIGGAASGTLKKGRSGSFEGQGMANVNRLQSRGEPGCFCMDRATYNTLSDTFKKEIQCTEKTVEGKHEGEERLHAFCCRMALVTGQRYESQEVASLLTDLNCHHQKEKFQYYMNKLELRAAFLVTASDLTTREWLLNLLSRKVRNYENSKKIVIRVTYLNRVDLKIWKKFSEEFHIPEEKQDEIMQEIANICQKRSIIIFVYDFSLNEESRPDLRDFWIRLLEKVKELGFSQSYHLILFIIDDKVEETHPPEKWFEIIKTENNVSDQKIEFKHLIALKTLTEITEGDVKGWFCSQPVEKLLGQDNVNLIIREYLPNQDWKGQQSSNVIDRICLEVFGVNIEDVKRFWSIR